MKSTYHTLPLIALLPCPKFWNLKKSLHGVIENRLMHHCLDIVCKPLKEASSKGAFMSDSLGRIRCYFSPLIAYIADTPKAAVIARVGGRTSHLTLASHKTFGDHFQHPTHLGSLTLAQIQTISEDVDPWDLEAYSKESQKRYCQEIGLVAFMFFFELLFSYVSLAISFYVSLTNLFSIILFFIC